MPPRLLMFDFDGTLADSFPWFLQVVNDAAARFGFRRIDAAEGERLRALDAARIMRALEVPAWKLPRIAHFMRARMREGIERIAPFAGTAEALERLHAGGATLAVVTSNAEDNVRHVLGAQALCFSHYACGVSLFGKRGRIESLLRRTGTAPAQAWMIGDELRDLDAARAAGVRFAAVGWGYTHAAALAAAAPQRMIDTPAALVELLDD